MSMNKYDFQCGDTGNAGATGNRAGRTRTGAVRVPVANNRVRDRNAAAREGATRVTDRRARGGAINAVRRSLRLR